MNEAPGRGWARSHMSLLEVKAEIPVAATEAVDHALLEAGLEKWSVLEDVIAKRAWVSGILADPAELQAAWPAIAELLVAAGVAAEVVPVVRTLADADWRDSYKAHFHAWQFGRLHWVPVWQRDTFQLPPGDAVLWLDPGLAFGTGNHETTRLCVERMVGLVERLKATSRPTRAPGCGDDLLPLRVVDAGCGSGILALSAALLGFRDVTGFDNDPEAVRVSEENAARNGLGGRVRFAVADLVGGLAGIEADLLLANIQADVLMRFTRELAAAVAPGGTLVLSGILAAENAQVRATFEAVAAGWTSDARTMGEWSDVVLTRPG